MDGAYILPCETDIPAIETAGMAAFLGRSGHKSDQQSRESPGMEWLDYGDAQQPVCHRCKGSNLCIVAPLVRISYGHQSGRTVPFLDTVDDDAV